MPYQAYSTRLDPLADFQAAEQMVDRGFQRQNLRQAGEAYSNGSRQEAADILAQGGNIQDAMKIEDQVRQDAKYDQTQEQNDTKERASFLLNVAQSLRQVPAAQRKQALATLTPVLSQIMPPEVLQQIGTSELSDQELDAFSTALGGELQKMQYFNTAGGVVGVGPTGQAQMVYAAEPRPQPNADLERQLLEAQIASTRALGGQRDASAAKARRPAGSGSAPKPPAGFILD